jgi:hypothetical protein
VHEKQREQHALLALDLNANLPTSHGNSADNNIQLSSHAEVGMIAKPKLPLTDATQRRDLESSRRMAGGTRESPDTTPMHLATKPSDASPLAAATSRNSKRHRVQASDADASVVGATAGRKERGQWDGNPQDSARDHYPGVPSSGAGKQRGAANANMQGEAMFDASELGDDAVIAMEAFLEEYEVLKERERTYKVSLQCVPDQLG